MANIIPNENIARSICELFNTRTNYCGCSHLLALKTQAKTSAGKKEINDLVQGDYELGSCTITLLSNPSHYIIDIKCLAEYAPLKNRTAFRESRRALLNKLMLCHSTYKEFIENSKGKSDGWIREEWFEQKKTPKHLSQIESIVLSIHLCLALRHNIELEVGESICGRSNDTRVN
jgi:hypothetical protein